MMTSFSRLNTSITQGSEFVTQTTETLPGGSKPLAPTQVPIYSDATATILAVTVLISAVLAGLDKKR